MLLYTLLFPRSSRQFNAEPELHNRRWSMFQWKARLRLCFLASSFRDEFSTLARHSICDSGSGQLHLVLSKLNDTKLWIRRCPPARVRESEKFGWIFAGGAHFMTLIIKHYFPKQWRKLNRKNYHSQSAHLARNF